MRYEYQNVTSEYDTARDEWTITDTTHPAAQARTADPELAYHATVAFAAEGPEPTGTRDSGDEDPHA